MGVLPRAAPTRCCAQPPPKPHDACRSISTVQVVRFGSGLGVGCVCVAWLCKHARCLRRKSKPSPGFRLRIRTLLTSLQVKEISKRETLFPAALNQTHPRVGEIKRSIKARELRVRGRPLSRGGMSPDVHNFDPVSAASLQRWYDLSHARRHRKFVGISTHRPLDRS